MRGCRPGGEATWVSALVVLMTDLSATCTLLCLLGKSWYSSAHCCRSHLRLLSAASTISKPDSASPTAYIPHAIVIITIIKTLSSQG